MKGENIPPYTSPYLTQFPMALHLPRSFHWVIWKLQSIVHNLPFPWYFFFLFTLKNPGYPLMTSFPLCFMTSKVSWCFLKSSPRLRVSGGQAAFQSPSRAIYFDLLYTSEFHITFFFKCSTRGKNSLETAIAVAYCLLCFSILPLCKFILILFHYHVLVDEGR